MFVIVAAILLWWVLSPAVSARARKLILLVLPTFVYRVRPRLGHQCAGGR
jgi:hypothetical protein